MVTLTDLEGAFLQRLDTGHWKCEGVPFAEADGLWLLCPVCFAANGGPVGTHRIVCWRPRVPLTESPGPGRWEFQGTGLEDLTLVAGSSSVLLTSGCRAHFFVRDGRIVPC